MRSSTGQPLKGKTGRPIPWIAYIWGISLKADGVRLIGRCLLEKIESFDSTQLASHGYAGLPLLASCVLLGNGRFTGLSVRHERKSYGAGRLIDGAGDRSRSVVVIDDCLVSGNSFHQAALALEADGYRVEGLVCLVDFPGRGGRSWAEAHGYRVESVFDVWSDLRLPQPQMPWWCAPPGQRPVLAAGRVDSNHAAFALLAAEQYLATGTVPAPPTEFCDDATGGVFVSIRNRLTGERLARRGYFRLPPADSGCAMDLGHVTADAVDVARSTIDSVGVAELAFGVTLVGDLEPVLPSELDAARFGIVVRSEVDPWRVGAALPNTESATTEIEQYREACAKARIITGEPHLLYRHSVTKVISDGACWPTFGAPVPEPAVPVQVAAELSSRMWSLLADEIAGPTSATISEATKDTLATAICEIEAVGVTLYRRGRLLGCWVSGGDTQESLARAVHGAWTDPRFVGPRSSAAASEFVVVLSLLHHRQAIGPCEAADATRWFRLGLDSIYISDEGRQGLVLSHVPCYNDWSAERTLERALARAGADSGPHIWYTYQTASWLCKPGRAPRPLEYGFPKRPARRTRRSAYWRDAMLVGNYIASQIGPSHLPTLCYYPVPDKHEASGSAARVILALESLQQAGLVLGADHFVQTARLGLAACLRQVNKTGDRYQLRMPGLSGGAGAECLLLTALTATQDGGLRGAAARGLVDGLSGLFHADGAISPLPPGLRAGTDDEMLSGAALLAAAALAGASSLGPLADSAHLADHSERILTWYRRSFEVRPSWGMVSWHARAWAALHALTDDARHAAFVFELTDWAIDRQLRKNGAFLTDLWHDGPSFHTAFVAEGVAAAWGIAERIGDHQRARKYAASWRAAMNFMDRLIVRRPDTFCMPRPSAALGGVRLSQASCQLRIDYAGHLLTALVGGIRLFGHSAA